MGKAYSYIDEDGLRGIVWAENQNQAKVEAQAESYMDYTKICVQREPWADRYSSMDEIPPQEFLDHGWSVTCSKCGREGLFVYDVRVIAGKAYCNSCAALEAGKDGK